MSINQKALKDLGKLSKDFNIFLNQYDSNSSKQKIKQYKNLLDFSRRINEAADKLKTSLEKELDLPSDELDFGAFLTDIGDSIVNTQQQLDEQSRHYLEGIKGEPHILPSVFRIPKVAADIKFGMRKSTGKGFNIIISKKSETDETTLNQSMHFEILSVPPPPDFQQRFYEQVPVVGFVFSPARRASVFSTIEKYQPRLTGQEDDQSDLRKTMLLDHQNDAMIIQVEPNTNKGFEDYLIIYADESVNKNVGIWLMQRHIPKEGEKAKPSIFEMVLKYSAKPRKGESYKILRDFVLSHQKLQQNILG